MRLLSVGIIISVLCNLATGYIGLSFADFFYDTPQSPIAGMRLRRVAAMVLAGISVPASGFLLQEFFRNPLAGPSVMGISSAAGLGVALYMAFSSGLQLPAFLDGSLTATAALAGSLISVLVLLTFAARLQDSNFLIIFGFLISAFCGAAMSIFQYYTDNQSLRNFILWSFGSTTALTGSQLLIFALFTIGGIIFSLKSINPLIGNILGEEYAATLGVDSARLKTHIIIASSLLCASATAFLGPVVFIGIVVPHFCRLIFRPAKLWHQGVLNVLMGILVMESLSILSEISLLPINIWSSLLGIPVIFAMMLRGRTTKIGY